MSRHSVIKVGRASARENLAWDAVAGMSETEVYERLFPDSGDRESVYEQPDWPRLHRELAKVGATLKLLHAEYRDQCQVAGRPSMGYDRFCKTYADYVRTQGISSRVGHKAGPRIGCRWQCLVAAPEFLTASVSSVDVVGRR